MSFVNSRRVGVFSGIVFLSISLWLCASVPCLAEEVQTLLIGDAPPLTGAAAAWGIAMTRGNDPLAEKINNQGGITVGGKRYMIKIDRYDTKGTAHGGASAANYFASKGIKFACFWLSAPGAAGQPICEENKIVTTHGGYTRTLRMAKYSFGCVQTPAEFIHGLLRYLGQAHPEIKKIGMIAANDESGKSTDQTWQKFAPMYGIKYLGGEFYPPRTTMDYVPMLKRLLALNPDALTTDAAPPAEVALIVKQVRQLGYKGMLMNETQTDANTLNDIAGQYAEGFLTQGDVDPNSPVAPPQMKQFYKAFISKYPPEEWKLLSIMAWDNLSILLQAIQAANTLDPTTVAELMPKLTYDTNWGPVKFGGEKTYDGWNHQLLIPVWLTQMRGGKSVFLKMVGHD